MQILHTLAAAVAALGFASAQVADFVEPQEVTVTPYYSAIAATSLADSRNYASPSTPPLCMTEVTRIREAVFNQTREILFEVSGCAVAKPQGMCKKSNKCTLLPFELYVLGPEKTPGFDALATLRLGKPTKTPYRIQAINRLV